MKRHVILLPILLISFFLFAQMLLALPPTWVEVTVGGRTSDEPVRLISTDIAATNFSIDVPGVQLERFANNKSQGFSRITMPTAGVNGRIGEPSLPVLRRMIRIPFGTEAEVQVEGVRFLTIDLADQGYEVPVWPQQPPIEKIQGARENADFIMNQDIYEGGLYSDELVTIESQGIIRGMRYILVTISPVAYNPAKNTIRVATDFVVTVHTPEKSGAVRSFTSNARLTDPSFEKLSESLFLNGRALNSRSKDLPTVPIGYLAITNNAYAANADVQQLLEHRTMRGYDVTVATTETIGGTKEEIKSYIQTAYDTWENPPAFVLLIGDTDVIPYWVGGGAGSPTTDLNYALLEGTDYVPDVNIGRLSVSGVGDFANVIGKTLEFENLDITPFDWVTTATFLASTDNYNVSEGTHNHVISTYLDPAGYTTYKRYTVTYNATAAQVTGDINAGLAQITYSGHGAVTYWADGPEYTSDDVNGLTNNVFPYVQSYACVTGQFDTGECFMETWLRADNGAVAATGSSVNSYWDEDDIMERAVYEAMYANPSGVNLTWLGGFTDYGKMALLLNYGDTSTVQRYYEMYNIMGDSAVDMWTGTPLALSPSYPPVIFFGAVNMTVDTGVVDAVAALSKDGALVGAARAGAGGAAVIEFDDPITEGGVYKLVITAHNYIPYEADITATAASSEGTIDLNRDIYSGNDTAQVLVADQDLIGGGTQAINAKSTADPDGITITLSELGSTGAFSGSFQTTTSASDTMLEVGAVDTITVTYIDADDGNGNYNVEVTDTAAADGVGPVFDGLDTATGGDTTVALTWNAAADDAQPITYAVFRANESGGYNFSEPVATTQDLYYTDEGLQNYHTYYYLVRATDSLGNEETNDVERPGRPIGPIPIWLETFEDKSLSEWTIENFNGGATWNDANPNSRSSSNWDTTFAICDNQGFLQQANDAMTSPVVDATGYADLEIRFGHSFLKDSWEDAVETGDVSTTAGTDWESIVTYSATANGEVRMDLSETYDETSSFQIKFHYVNQGLFSNGYWGADNIGLYGMPTEVEAGFSATPLSGEAPLEVSFINETFGAYDSCTWDFGDSETGEGDSPVHVFQNPGVYTVSMVVSGDFGSETVTKEEYIEVTEGTGDDDDDDDDNDTGGDDDDDDNDDDNDAGDDDDDDDDSCGC